MMIVRYSPGARRLSSAPIRLTMCATSSTICATSTSRRTLRKTHPTEPRPIDARTTRHPGPAISQRKRTEEPFGWAKTIGVVSRGPMLRGVARLRFKFTLTMAAYDGSVAELAWLARNGRKSSKMESTPTNLATMNSLSPCPTAVHQAP
jgi:hypothetical protein